MEIAVPGAGVMGHGFAPVCAMAGDTVALRDVERGPLEQGLADIRGNHEDGIDRGEVTPQGRDDFLSRTPGTTDQEEAVSGADQVVEVVPEDLTGKRETFTDVDRAIELGYDHPMGAPERTDHVGLQVRHDVLEHSCRELGAWFRSPQIRKRTVRGGGRGRESGEGFDVREDGDSVRSVS